MSNAVVSTSSLYRLSVSISGFLLLLGVATAQQINSSTTIYKFVDENGRVTYANTPLKGGTKVSLEPLTIMSSNNNASATNPPPTMPATLAAKVDVMIQPGRATIAPLAQRREEIRRRILEEEIAQEEKMLQGARQTLANEENKSPIFRAMRASFSTAIDKNTSAVNEARLAVESHFERKRILQDQIAGHEQNIAALRQELAQNQSKMP